MTAPAMRLQSVDFGYRRGRRILNGISHDFEQGTISVLTGPSGAGKSTLLYLIGLLLRPSGGDIELHSTPTARLSDAQRSALRAQAIGFVFQDAALDPTRTVVANVTEGAIYAGYTRRDGRRRAHELLDRFGVELSHDARPGQVSGGQAARVGLCRALVKNPTIILADEPTGNLDASSASTVLDAFDDAATRGRTVIVASHDDRVIDRWGSSISVGA